MEKMAASIRSSITWQISNLPVIQRWGEALLIG